jgi:hypothetical protein
MEHTPMSSPISLALASIALGDTREYGGLAVTPLVGVDEPACEYVTLDDALAAGTITITEVSDSGSVPELRVINRGITPVLIVDGEELVGAKQNRVINLTILVAAARNTTIPVSCVEAGRWRRDSGQFASSPRTQFASGRAAKMAQVSRSMADHGGRRSDQGAVWEAIAEKAARMDAPSATSAMSAIFEHHAGAVDEYVSRLGTIERQRGAIFSVAGHPTGIELFDRAEVCRRLMPKLLRGYAIDAVEHGVERTAVLPAAREWLNVVATANSRAFAAVGEGDDLRLEASSLVGGALVVDGRVVHLAAFATAV